MARTLRLLPRLRQNRWANWCRATRARTRTTRSRCIGEWPLTPAQFTAWLNQHLEAHEIPTITEWTYINWEQARVTPSVAVQNEIRLVVKKHIREVIHRPKKKPVDKPVGKNGKILRDS